MVIMKKFLIIGNANSITYKEIFPLIKENKLWLGVHNRIKEFISDDGHIKKFGNVMWYTNMGHNKRNEPLILTKKYDPALYPKYDNYDAIEVSRITDTPMDYDGIMGVPITFLDKYCPEQFEIIDVWNDGTSGGVLGAQRCKIETSRKGIKRYRYFKGPIIDGKAVYKRLLIKRKTYERISDNR